MKYRLGKLRICTYYLKELIDIITKCLKLDADPLDMVTIEEFFEFVQVKIDASLELAKLYYYFDEFSSMKHLLENMSVFSEAVSQCDTLSEKQQNILRFFRTKTYSMLGVCLAGVREFRNSRLASKKALALVEQEIERKRSFSTSQSDLKPTTLAETTGAVSHHLKSLHIECLLDTCSSLSQMKRTFKQMREFNMDFLKSGEARFVAHELAGMVGAARQRIEFARQAYLMSTTLIDPGLRVRVTFNLALALYDNNLYQSAAYYFTQLLSISVGLLNKRPNSVNSIDNDIYNDLNPEYHLEAGVYLVKCYLMIDYFGVQSAVDLDEKFEFKTESMESLETRIMKSIETIIKLDRFGSFSSKL